MTYTGFSPICPCTEAEMKLYLDGAFYTMTTRNNGATDVFATVVPLDYMPGLAVRRGYERNCGDDDDGYIALPRMARQWQKPWTDDEFEVMKRMADEGKTFREVAVHLGRGESSVCKAYRKKFGRRHLADEAPYRWKLEDDAALIDMYRRHKSYAQMVPRLKRSVSAICSRVKALRARGQLV